MTEDSKRLHTICQTCHWLLNRGREDLTLRGPCCFCGDQTLPTYLFIWNANEVPCSGKHVVKRPSSPTRL